MVLALALGANTALFSVIETVLLRPFPYRDPQRLAVLWKAVPSKQIEWDWSSGPIVQDWRARNHAFEDLAIFLRPEASMVTWSTNNGPEKIQACKTQGSFFEMLGVSPVLGRAFSREELRRGDALAILSHGFWQRRFGAEKGILGKTLSLDGSSFTIIGVMPPEFQFPDRKTALWLPLESDPRWALWQQQRFRMADAFSGLARLKPGYSIAEARADMNTLAQGLAREHPETDAGLGVRVVPLAEQIAGVRLRRSLWLLEGAVLCVLLIACSNIASLLAVRGLSRRRELAIRAALGAGRGRILRQLAAENLLLFVTGGLLGLLAAAWSLQALLALAPPGVPRLEGAGINFTVFAFAFGLSLITGAIFGVLPALQATMKQPEADLRDAGRVASAGPGAHGLRRCLVIAQFALAVVLLGAAGLLVRSFRLLLEVNPGFDTTHLLTMLVELPESRYKSEERIRAFTEQAIQKINGLPGVRGAAAGSASIRIFSGQTPDESIVLADRPFAPDFQRHQRDLVSDDYFRVMGIPLRHGRLFSAEDEHAGARGCDQRNHGAALLAGRESVGQALQRGVAGHGRHVDDGGGCCGRCVAKSGRQRGSDVLLVDSAMVAFQDGDGGPHEFGTGLSGRCGARSGTIRGSVASSLRRDAGSVAPAGTGRSAAVPGGVAGIFAVCALLLAAVGLHGLLRSSVEQRTREIGIRVALGATAANVIRLIVREGLLSRWPEQPSVWQARWLPAMLFRVAVRNHSGGSTHVARCARSVRGGHTRRELLRRATLCPH